MFKASCELDKLFTKIDVPGGQGVYVHDTNAVNEAPTLVVAWLALFCRHPDWEDLEALRKFLKEFNSTVMPHMKIVNLLIEKYRKFQEEQRLKRLKEDEERRKREEEEKRKRDQLGKS